MNRQAAGFMLRHVMNTQFVEPTVGLGERPGGDFIQAWQLTRASLPHTLQTIRAPDLWVRKNSKQGDNPPEQAVLRSQRYEYVPCSRSRLAGRVHLDMERL